MNKNESKYFNTAIKMDKALIELLEKKDFEYITIKEICSQAGVNRSTFYLHYENTTDLLDETTEYVTNSFLSCFSGEEQQGKMNFEKSELNDLLFIKPEYIFPYLTYIKDNQMIFKTSLKHLGLMKFDAVYEKLFKYIFNPILERFNYPENERAYIMRFYLTGITAIVSEWVRNNCRDSVEMISGVIVKCIINNTSIYNLISPQINKSII